MQAVVNAVQEYMGPVPGTSLGGGNENMRILLTCFCSVAAKPEYNHRPDGEMMQALQWQGNMDVRMGSVNVPDITQERDIILKVTGTTICGSDLHLYHSEMLGLQKNDIL
jgi:hypothetical protein